MEVFLRREHGAPGCLPSGAVGEAADHRVRQAVVIPLPLRLPKHRGGRPAHLQALFPRSPAAQASDAPIHRAVHPAPAAIPLPLQRGHADPLIHQGRFRHGGHQGAQGIVGRQCSEIHLSTPALQLRLQLRKGQGLAGYLGVARTPRPGADVFEIDREQSLITGQGLEGQVVVVEAHPAAAEAIAPAQQ